MRIAGKIQKPLLITIPHSGEKVPDEAPWLKALPETLLMFDIDRYVDRLYEPVLKKLALPYVKTEWHRYAIDLNRLADDVDCDSVEGHTNPSGKYPRGLHWSITTKRERLMAKPMPLSVHQTMVERYFDPFHREVRAALGEIRNAGAKTTFHIDLHSMPSMGTSEHRDPGERRADIVVSDCEGKSCSASFKDLVISSYKKAGFSVAYNWPYVGGRVTETYGRPGEAQEAIQVEFNRGLYMDETSKRLIDDRLETVQKQLGGAIESVFNALPDLH